MPTAPTRPSTSRSSAGRPLSEDADLVIGSRMAGADSQMPFVRRLGNLIFANLVSLVSARRVTDSASRHAGLQEVRSWSRLYPLPDGLNLTPVMSTRALHEDLRTLEVPIPYSERRGRSKLSVLRDGLRFAESIVWTALNYNPVQLLGVAGLVALALAALAGLVLVAARLAGVTSFTYLGAGAIFFALVLAVAGISLLALGISFNYFVALFHKQPVRQGLFGRRSALGRPDRYFGLAGLGSLVLGALLALTGLAARRRRPPGRAAVDLLPGQRLLRPGRHPARRLVGADAGARRPAPA